jgi:hypothetical protein
MFHGLLFSSSKTLLNFQQNTQQYMLEERTLVTMILTLYKTPYMLQSKDIGHFIHTLSFLNGGLY